MFESFVVGGSCGDKLDGWHGSPAAMVVQLAKMPPNHVIADFGRGSNVESESE